MKKGLLSLFFGSIMSLGFAQVDCDIAHIQGGFAGGYLNWTLGSGGIYALIDPADDYGIAQNCGASYPYTIEQVSFSLASSTAFGQGTGIGTFSYRLSIYGLNAGDPCNFPGGLIATSGPITVNLNGATLTPQTFTFNVDVNDAFFVSYEPLSWTGPANQVPSILWDNVARPLCVQFMSEDGVEFADFTDFFDGGETGWAGFTIFGSSDTSVEVPCEAGTIADTTPLVLCPDEDGTFSTGGTQSIPVGHFYALDFVPTTGTGALEDQFFLTNVTLPYTLNNDLNGVLSGNGFPPFEGEWLVSGVVYSDPDDIEGSICSSTVSTLSVTFLTEADPACSGGGCVADIPYSLDDPCVILVTLEDPFCCDTEWDGTCETAYQNCIGGGGDCNAGIIESPLAQNICPDELANYDVSGSILPVDGDYALSFTPDGGTGGMAGGFTLTGVEIPFDFDSDLNGVLSANSLPPLQGQWVIFGLVYTDPDDIGGSLCSLTDDQITLNFLSADDPLCNGSGDCLADAPYTNDDPCYQFVIVEDPFCCDTEWDDVCQDQYDLCAGSGGDCLIWVNPSPTTGWVDFNEEFGGAPVAENGVCPFNEITLFEVWESEAYLLENVQAGTMYTFSHCNGPGAGSWIPTYAIIAPSGAIDASGAGDGDGCSISWMASESGDYLIVINEEGNCGIAGQTDNGYPAITCTVVTDVNELTDNELISVFPNPNSGNFVIDYAGNQGSALIEVMDITGKAVYSTQQGVASGSRIDINLGHAPGVYFVRFTMNNESSVLKVVVN